MSIVITDDVERSGITLLYRKVTILGCVKRIAL